MASEPKTYYEEAREEVSEEIERHILAAKVEMQGSRRHIKSKDTSYDWNRHLRVEAEVKRFWERALRGIDDDSYDT